MFSVHYSQIEQDGYKTLNEGELVEFDLYQSGTWCKPSMLLKI